ncbi:mitochondrial outer membrane protein iml-2 [Grosmannia clavigera kw1407]|uniref:Inclusion body clearance protein IML2 n=1 Tax=Grosmannia clavigera (strain kw1407 / UAMH 11150) TaxID=655863 RepID=F0XL48_GROCL|nr:mitochondrial outer membrane protein iml-2 [Grosmannia clavigera kw1407]EFX01609.1 mitochondrial outer membrane protein iml-2 [Grosmannia clavigera kw1407]
MSLRNWFRGVPASTPAGRASSGPSPVVSASTSAAAIADSEQDGEIPDLEDAMAATALILNGDINGAEARLRRRKDGSTFHQLGLGISTFVASVLGFEKDIMAEATARLIDCEARAWADMKKAQKQAAMQSSTQPQPSVHGKPATQTYPPGSEFALVHAEAQLMLAIIAVLHESLTEAIKGFYKLRKVYISLNGIMESEIAFFNHENGITGKIAERSALTEDKMPGTFDDAEFTSVESSDNSDTGRVDGTRDDFVVGANTLDAMRRIVTPRNSPKSRVTFPHAEEANIGSKNGHNDFTDSVDIFVHSGANMCFGILLLLILMVPPAFSRLLYVIGFKGDRDRGVRMLWRSTKFDNVNGGVAGLVLLAYYNGSIGYCDIIPTQADVKELADPEEIVGYPRKRCKNLLEQMRSLYPDSMLWRLEEARALAIGRNIEEAIGILSMGDAGRMRQITALTKFELALNAMCAMDWRLMRDAFLHCVKLNDWSHALYYYNAGCAELELYRDAFDQASSLLDEAKKSEAKTAASKHKKAAEDLFRLAPTMAGKKKFMSRQMPFDAFVIRKITKWEERAKALNIDLADSIGASPAQEMIYLWNGSKRMRARFLEKALTCLRWKRCTAGLDVVKVFRATTDEWTMGNLCQVSLMRSLGRTEDARVVLERDILVHDR